MEDGPNLLQVSEKGRGKRSIDLEGLVFLGVISTISQDGGTGSHLHANGGILGLLLPKGRVVILALRDELVSHNIDEWDTCHASDAGQNGLHLLKCPHGRGYVKGYGDEVRLLVIRSPGILKAILHPEQVDHHKCGPHKWHHRPRYGWY
jgi:hypothetical protein